MGGIAGIVHLRGDAPGAEPIERMSRAVAHRGTDDRGVWLDGPAAFAQRRMSLTRRGRRQPVRTDRFVLVMDGRLSEPAALAARLDAPAPFPRETDGDADLLLAAWARWGDGCLEHLSGSFAFAVWDRRDRALHLARDRAGTRPLFYAHVQDRFAFASDVRALLTLPWVSREPARERIAEYLSFRYVHAPHTLLRDVCSLPAATVARVDVAGMRSERWWLPSYAVPGEPQPDEGTACDALSRTLTEAVERQLRSDHPVGLLHSGGIGSSAILLAARHLGAALPAFTVSFADGGVDEAGLAGRVATLFGSEHHLLRLDREAFTAALTPCTDLLGMPVTSPTAVLQYLLCRRARLGDDEGEGARVRVLLTGDGSDELLGGSRAAALMPELRLDRLAARVPMVAAVARGALHRLRGAPTPVEGAAGLAQGGSRGAPFGLDRLVGGSQVFSVEDRIALLRDPAHVRAGMRRTMLEPLYNEVRADPINGVLHVYLRGWLAEDTLARVDHTAAGSGLEPRCPFLDEAVVDLCTRWPSSAKIKRRQGHWYGKWPLRQWLERHLPAELVWRPKRGVPYPLGKWLRGAGEAFLWERTESVCEDPLGLFRPEQVRELARQHARGEADRAPQLWTLFFFDLWWRNLKS